MDSKAASIFFLFVHFFRISLDIDGKQVEGDESDKTLINQLLLVCEKGRKSHYGETTALFGKTLLYYMQFDERYLFSFRLYHLKSSSISCDG